MTIISSGSETKEEGQEQVELIMVFELKTGRKEMEILTMSQINHFKDLSNCGYCFSEISVKTGADTKNI